MDDQVLYESGDWVATITLNRPEKLNAWTRQMEEQFTWAIRRAEGDDAVRAIVVTGAGRGFCAGADMSLLSAVSSGGEVGEHQRVSAGGMSGNQWPHAWLLEVPKPIFAAINGAAVGLGFVIPLFCDYRIASTAAWFNVMFSRRGLIAEYGLAWMLPRLIGLPKAIDVIFSSRSFGAEEALSMGLVQRVLPAEGFLAAVQSMAGELAISASPRSLRVMKRQIYQAQSQSLEQAMQVAIEEMLASLRCEDFKEGVAHFLEKRAPRFSGR